MMKKITFALFFGNRGFFSPEPIAGAIAEMKQTVLECGFDYICCKESLTRYGAVETAAEGRIYVGFLEENRGKYDGVILCLPNFGDENGILAALGDVKVPILVQAYPDKLGKMSFIERRDSMCGKFAACNILRQAGIPYTLTRKFAVDPLSADFKNDLQNFAAVCRIVRGMRKFNIGAIGARTTAFKTVRVDELALQKKGINVETIDLSSVFGRMETAAAEKIAEAKAKILKAAEYHGDGEKLLQPARLQAALEEITAEYSLDAIATRCWDELPKYRGIVPCVNVGLLNDIGIPTACEVDIENAVMMKAVSLAADSACTLLDYNNNYGYDTDKSIMFHCGPVPVSMMKGKGRIGEHKMFVKTYGCGTGINKGELKEGEVTFGSVKTENGEIYAFVSKGEFTSDSFDEDFFGVGKVIHREGLNNVSNYMAENGYKHHLAVTYGNYAESIQEAFSKYLGYKSVIL